MERLFLLFHGRFPSEKAASLFAAKSAEAFAREGLDVTLLVPNRLRQPVDDPFAFYQIEANFRIVFLPTVDLFSVPLARRIAFEVSLLAFSLSAFAWLWRYAKKGDLVYSNETLPLYSASLLPLRAFFEAHELPRKKTWFYRQLFGRVRGIVTNNAWKQTELRRRFALPAGQILRELNAVDLAQFEMRQTLEAARAQLSLPREKKIALYTGHLYGWKGVDTLAAAAALLPTGVETYFVGGTEEDLRRFRTRYGKLSGVSIIGHRPHQEIPLWQAAADVLVVPNTAKEAISKYDTSPMKIFEYMASGKPIVASDLPSIREILNETNAQFVAPDDPRALADGILAVLVDPEAARTRARQASQDVRAHGWKERAQRILSFIRERSAN